MNERERQELYRFKKFKWIGPWYYDHPDGEDLLGKMTFCGELMFLLSAPIGVFNAYIRYPYPTSQWGRWLRVTRAVMPGVGMGLTFAITTYYSTRIRQKDDSLNHSVGGMAAGIVFGAVNGLARGVSVAILLAGFAAALKHNKEDLEKSNVKQRHFAPFVQRNLDFSGIPEFKGNWLKAEPPQK